MKQNKRSQNKLGQQRSAAWKQRQLKQQKQENRRNYQKAISYTQAVSCQCARCGAPKTERVEKRTMNLLGSRIIAWCGNCGAWRMMEIPDREACPVQAVRKEINNACKSTGLRYRFDGQYAIITGRTVRWYVDFSSLHKSAFYCGKHKRVWGRNTDYGLFYDRRKVSAVDAILEIGAYDQMFGDSPSPLTKEVRDNIRKERIRQICAKHGFGVVFKEPFACIKTDLSDWRFDYHRDRFTLLHKNDTPMLDELTGAVMDYHVQFANYDLTVEQVINGIAGHEEWKKQHDTFAAAAETQRAALE